MLNYTILSKPTTFFSFIKPLKAIYSRFKRKWSKNGFYEGFRKAKRHKATVNRKVSKTKFR